MYWYCLILPLQLLTLHEKYGKTEHMEPSSHLSTFSRPSTYTTTLGGYPSLSSTLLPPYTSSPYSLSTHLPTPTSTTSLEPFKLTFSLPSSNSSLTTSSERATLTNSGRLPQLSSSTDEHTGESTHTCAHTNKHSACHYIHVCSL